MTDEKRPYRMTKRAELEERTRLRITESAVELHRTLGPSKTSISALAEHAGVRRSTVYRHFPDELSLFAACTGHWMAANPVPDLAPWAAVADPDLRLRTALEELYAYYRRTRDMMANIHRDEETMPNVKQMMGGFRGYLAGAGDVLMQGRAPEDPRRRLTAAAIGHALSFETWRSLAIAQGLDDAECAALMCALVAAAEAG